MTAGAGRCAAYLRHGASSRGRRTLCPRHLLNPVGEQATRYANARGCKLTEGLQSTGGRTLQPQRYATVTRNQRRCSE